MAKRARRAAADARGWWPLGAVLVATAACSDTLDAPHPGAPDAGGRGGAGGAAAGAVTGGGAGAGGTGGSGTSGTGGAGACEANRGNGIPINSGTLSAS